MPPEVSLHRLHNRAAAVGSFDFCDETHSSSQTQQKTRQIHSRNKLSRIKCSKHIICHLENRKADLAFCFTIIQWSLLHPFSIYSCSTHTRKCKISLAVSFSPFNSQMQISLSLFVFNFRYNSLIANCFTNNLHFLSLHFIPYFSLLWSLDSFFLSFFNSFSLSLSFLKPTRINVHLNFCLSLSVKMRERKGEREEN